MKNIRWVIVVFVVLGLFCSNFALAASIDPPVYLPDPTQLYGGVPVASAHDDFWSYSAKALDAAQDQGYLPGNSSNFQFPTGTGGLDVLLYTGSVGQNNQQVGPDGPDAGNQGDFNFEDPVVDQGGSQTTSFHGWWGQQDQNNDGTQEAVNGPVTVGNVLNYLHALDPLNNIPVFYFDLNQTGTAASMSFSGRVYLTDGTYNTTTGQYNFVHEWAFDNTPGGSYPTTPALPDGDFDINSVVLAPGEVSLPFENGSVTVDHNLGSGKPDFIAYAPTMDLSLYASSLWFVVEFYMEGLNNGPEEIFLSGNIFSTDPPVPEPVPEPATLLLLGCGLVGAAAFGKKKLRKRKRKES